MRYIASSVISFSVSINGRDKRVRFNPVMDGGSSYVTNEPAEIEALEKLSSFQRGVFGRAPGEAKVSEKVNTSSNGGKGKEAKGKGGRPKKNEKDATLTPIDAVTTWQEAAEYLAENCESESLAEPDAILEEATKKGVSFPNLK